MNDPRRLVEESESRLERELLRAGSSYRASGSTRAKTLIALGLASSAALSASGATASVLAKSGWTKVLAISALGAVTAVPILTDVLDRDAPVAVVTAAPRPPARAVSAPLEAAPVEQQQPAPALMQPEKAEAPPAAARKPSATRVSAPRPTNPALADELTALDSARAALATGDSRKALAQLDAYAKAHPRGRLQVEAEVLRIDALVKAGQRQAAARRAENFLRRHPNSVLASRVRSYL